MGKVKAGQERSPQPLCSANLGLGKLIKQGRWSEPLLITASGGFDIFINLEYSALADRKLVLDKVNGKLIVSIPLCVLMSFLCPGFG